MSPATDTIFSLHSAAVVDYRDFIHSFLVIADERARQFVEEALAEQGRLWLEELVQLSPAYASGASVGELAGQGLIGKESAKIFRRSDGGPILLYRHQEEAIGNALAGLTKAPVKRELGRMVVSWYRDLQKPPWQQQYGMHRKFNLWGFPDEEGRPFNHFSMRLNEWPEQASLF